MMPTSYGRLGLARHFRSSDGGGLKLRLPAGWWIAPHSFQNDEGKQEAGCLWLR